MTINAKSTETVRYQFTAAEKRELAERLAAEVRRAFELDQQKKLLTGELAQSIKAANAAADSFAEKYQNGYEMRDMECGVIYDQPRPGRKIIVRPDTGEVHREDDMTPAERQRTLEFDPNAPKN